MTALKHIKFLLLFLFLYQSYVYSQFPEEKISDLQATLDSIVSPVTADGITVSVKVIHADYNRMLYELNPELQVIPASITKLITSACAFVKLGQGYDFKTVIFTDDHNLSDGTVNGNLYLKGYGDPDLNSSDISYLCSLIVKNNIKEVTGNIVADESYFDNDYYTLSKYFKGDTGPSYWPYITALSLDKNNSKYNPALSAANLLSSLLNSSGIVVSGTSITGSTPKGTKEIARITHSIYDVLSYMTKESDNHSAITVFKLLGAHVKSNPGSLKNGQEVIETFLDGLGVDRYSYEILEGSGLTRYNKVSAEVYMKLLKYMYDDRLLFDYFLNSLSVAGKDGTLRKRMKGTEAEGNVFAKTGTLNGVSALSGYVIDKDNEVLIFFIVMNGFKGDAVSIREVQDDICITLAGFSRK